MLLPGLLALSLVTLVREFRGRAVLAGAVALTAVAPAVGVYESMDRGPLLPFAARGGADAAGRGGVAALPGARRAGHRPGAGAGRGGLAVHPLVDVVRRDPVRRAAAGAALAVRAGAGSAATCWRCCRSRWCRCWSRGCSCSARSGWPAATCRTAAGRVGYRASRRWARCWASSTTKPHPQIWLSVALFLGFVFFARGGRAALDRRDRAVITGLAYMAVASSNKPLVMACPGRGGTTRTGSSRWRRSRCACWPAHGLASTQAWLRDRLPSRGAGRGDRRWWCCWGFVVLTNGLYFRSNSARVYPGYQAADPSTLP